MNLKYEIEIGYFKRVVEIDANGQMTVFGTSTSEALWSSYVPDASAEVKHLATLVIEAHLDAVQKLKQRIGG